MTLFVARRIPSRQLWGFYFETSVHKQNYEPEMENIEKHEKLRIRQQDM